MLPPAAPPGRSRGDRRLGEALQPSQLAVEPGSRIAGWALAESLAEHIAQAAAAALCGCLLQLAENVTETAAALLAALAERPAEKVA